jgi:hypothetical protein
VKLDIAYISGQIADHQKTVQLLEWEIGSGQDADLQHATSRRIWQAKRSPMPPRRRPRSSPPAGSIELFPALFFGQSRRVFLEVTLAIPVMRGSPPTAAFSASTLPSSPLPVAVSESAWRCRFAMASAVMKPPIGHGEVRRGTDRCRHSEPDGRSRTAKCGVYVPSAQQEPAERAE